MDREKLEKIARLSVQYDRFVNSDLVDDANERLLSSHHDATAEKLRRGDATLRKIATADPTLTQAELRQLVEEDFRVLTDHIRAGDGLKEAISEGGQEMITANFDTVKTLMDSVTRASETRKRMDTPPLLNGNEINFDDANTIAVIPTATKFILPVSDLGNTGEALVYPAGHENAGKPITDYEGKVVGGNGIVFENRTESVAYARGDGTAVFIINNVKAEQAE